VPDPYDWQSDDEARQREALRHSMFNPDIPGYSLYEARWTPWALAGLVVAMAALVALALVIVRPEPFGPGYRVEADTNGCYRVSAAREGSPPSPALELVEGVFDACYRDALDGALFVAPIDVPTYRSSAAFFVAAPFEFDRLVADEPYVLTELGGGLFAVQTGADELPLVHVRGSRGPWTCPLADGGGACTSP
jgi:hypothetical protein